MEIDQNETCGQMSRLNKKREDAREKPRLLFLDTAYTLKICRKRELEQEFISRECGGYFDHVWGVHPIADIPERRKLNYEGFKLSVSEFSSNQTVIEGLSAYFSTLKHCFHVNFIVSQTRFIHYLIRLVKSRRISIIVSTDPYFCGLIGLFIKLFTRVPLVIWVCGNYDDTFHATKIPAMPRLFRWRWVEKIVERIVLSMADLVAGGNHNNLEFALKNGAIPGKSTVFPVGKLIHRRHLMQPPLREKDELFVTSRNLRHFIYVGRLAEVKHPDDALRAFSMIDKGAPDCALIMAGDGSMRADLEKMARELGIHDKVHFLGNISQKRLASLLAGCFAVLSPLTGRSLVECALAGLPIVAYDRDWQGDFIGKSGAGLIVPFRDWQKMGQAAIHLLCNAEDARRMGEASLRKGREFCDLDKIYGHERMEFDKLLKRKSGGVS